MRSEYRREREKGGRQKRRAGAPETEVDEGKGREGRNKAKGGKGQKANVDLAP